jgi:hypothetical protein
MAQRGVSTLVPLDTIRAAYFELGRIVYVSLQTQMGDAARLGQTRRECVQLLAMAQQVSLLRPLPLSNHSEFLVEIY